MEPGTTLGDRFRIVRAVGAGGMGVVYEALDLKLDRRVALKCARPGHRYQLTPEARAAREVSHFNISKVHDIHTFETAEGTVDCLSMEFIEGETLSQRIRSKGPLPPKEAKDIALQICSGLEQAHRQGVIHGDLKTGNVILSKTRVVITDFGLARLAEEPSERGVRGTYDYMAPEQLLGEPPTVASDIYALGVLFHMMLTGHTPRRLREQRDADTKAPTRTVVNGVDEAQWQREISPLLSPWKRIVTRCLAASPTDRYRSAAAIASALQPRRLMLKIAAAAVLAAILIFAGRQWRNQIPITPVRLAVLPFVTEGDAVNLAGIATEVSQRLSGARSKFITIPPREAERNQVTSGEKARTILGATHVMETHIRASGGSFTANATLIDLKSGNNIGQLQGTYALSDGAVLANALVGTVSTAFRLPKRSGQPAVSAAAYGYYVEGIELLRRDAAAYADKVIPMFDRAHELDPKSALPLAALVEAQMERFLRGDGAQWLEQAEANAAKATSIDPDSLPVLLASGVVQQQRGRYEQALQLLTRATELAPDDSEAWRKLAQCYESAGRFDEAVATYQRAVAAQPDYYRHHLSLGTFYFNRGQFSRAEPEYRRVTEIAPALASGHMNLGLALMQQGRFAESESQLLEALKLGRTPNMLVNVAAMYYEEGKFQEAAEYFESSMRDTAPSSVQWRGWGDAQRHLGHAKQAAEAYQKALDLALADVTRNPRRASAHSTLGMLYALLKDRASAQYELSQALSYDAENRSVMRDAAIGYEFMGQREAALTALAKAPRPLLEELTRQPDVVTLQSDARFRTLLSNSPAN